MKPPTLLFGPTGSAKRWVPALKEHMPELSIRVWPDIGAREDIDFVMFWRPPHGLMTTLPNLRLIQSLGAGVEHLLEDPELPAHVPIVRLVDPYMTRTMAEYVVCHVMRLHRQDHLYAPQQLRREWKAHAQVNAGQRTIGFLGMGELGQDSAKLLHGLGFNVLGWNRSGRHVEGIEMTSGRDGMRALARRSDTIVCLLPLTPETTHVLGEPLFSWLPRGACIINCGRGGHVHEHDLLQHLRSGHLAAAVLDVFDQEPLPPDHPLWTTPGVSVTPHIAAQSNPPTGAPIVIAAIRACIAGAPIPNLVAREVGY